MPSNHLILCHPFLLLPSILPSIRVFSNELALYIRWLKNWSFSFSIGFSNQYSGLISFRIDWFDPLAIQGTFGRKKKESSPAPQFEGINSSVLSLFYCPAHTSIHDYWKNHAAAAAAKSLQSCPTLCDPIDSSPPGSPIPGIFQARTLEWGAISFSNA